jgi:hypothetical protein
MCARRKWRADIPRNDGSHLRGHDGYRLIVRSDGDTVRLFTRRGYDNTLSTGGIAGHDAPLPAIMVSGHAPAKARHQHKPLAKDGCLPGAYQFATSSEKNID